MKDITLQLDWQPNSQFAGILFAHHLGWYEKAGINLTLVPWKAGTNPMDALQSAENVISSAEDNLVIRARAAGRPIKAITAMMQFSGLGWMTLKDSSIKTISDFKGKRIGIHGDGETGLKIAASRFGIDWKDMDVLVVGFEKGELLRDGKLDAAQCLGMIEPSELEEQGVEVRTMFGYEGGFEVYSQVLSTNETYLAAEPEALTNLLKVTYDGFRLAFERPGEIARIIVEKYLPGGDPAFEEKIFLSMRPLFEGKVGLDRMGWMEKTRWEKSIDLMVSHQYIDRPISTEEVMTNTLMEKVYSN